MTTPVAQHIIPPNSFPDSGPDCFMTTAPPYILQMPKSSPQNPRNVNNGRNQNLFLAVICIGILLVGGDRGVVWDGVLDGDWDSISKAQSVVDDEGGAEF